MAAKTQLVKRGFSSKKVVMREEITGRRVSPALWGVNDVAEWIDKLIDVNQDDKTNFVAELGELRKQCIKHEVTGRILQLLDKDGLRELGLESLVHCARLLSALEIMTKAAAEEDSERSGIFANQALSGVVDAQGFADILEKIETDPKEFKQFLHPDGIQGLFSKHSMATRWLLKFIHLMGNQDLFLFVPLAIIFGYSAYNAYDKSSEKGDWLRTENAEKSVCIFSVLNIVIYRLSVPLQYRLAEDLFDNIDLHTDVKQNVRSSWTNTALVSALFLTFAFPMAQVDNPKIDYLCATVSAIVSAIVSMLVPTITLLYTEHLSTDDAINFFLCYCWTITLPIVYTGVSALWLLIALGLWVANQYGMSIGVYAFVSLAWCFWRVTQVWIVCSDFAPQDRPVPARGGKWNPYNRATKILALKMLKIYAAKRSVFSESHSSAPMRAMTKSSLETARAQRLRASAPAAAEESWLGPLGGAGRVVV